ncbi:RHS domain-containing protein [Labrys sp. LIt4]|nr:RHS domain-containing protein [Labrys sp. LIt4]
MDNLDASIAKLKGPDWGYGKGYEDLIQKWCRQKNEIKKETPTTWWQEHFGPGTPGERALAETVGGVAEAAIGGRSGVQGNGFGMRPRPSPSGVARSVEAPPSGGPSAGAIARETPSAGISAAEAPPVSAAAREAQSGGNTASEAPSSRPPGQLGRQTEDPPPETPPPANTGNAVPRRGEPVAVTNGEYLETWEDFLIPGTLPFDGARYMGLKLGLPTRYRGPLGPCQISAFDEIITNPRRGELTYFNASGEEIGFERPFNILEATNPAFPGLSLTAPWLRQLQLEDGRLVKHFRQYADNIYRLQTIETLDGAKAIFHRSETGALTRLDGPDGLSLIFENDAEDRRTAISLIGTDGSVLELARYAYDTRGRMISSDCAFGMSVRYDWSRTKPLLKRWTNLSQRTESVFSYDTQGRVVRTMTNGLWNDDRFHYDSEKRQTVYMPAGQVERAERFAYDAQENVTEETNALGAVTRHDYDEFGRRTSTADANGNMLAREYDAFGNILSITDGEGRSTLYKWTPRRQLAMVIDGAGNARRMAYDGKARPVLFTDAEDHVTAFSHDDQGRLIAITRPNGAVERRSYDEHNRLVAVTDAKGSVTRYEHDAYGRVVSVTDALGGVTHLAYDAGAGGFAVPTRLTRPDGVTVARSYDREGTLATVTDGEGRQWTYQHGAFGVLEAIVDPKGGRLCFGYDSEGRLLTVTNANGQIWTFTRDVAGQVIAEEDYDGRRIVYERDAAGQVIAIRYADGTRRHFAYDKSGLLVREESFAPPSAKQEDGDTELEDVTRYWYDDRGLLIQAENKASLVALERDGNGRIVAETINGRRVESRYDENALRVERRILGSNPGSSHLVEIERDPLGLVARLTIDGHQPLVFSHDRLGRETRRASAAGFALHQHHDAIGQLLHQSAGRLLDAGFAGFGHAVDLDAGVASPKAASGVERRYSWDRAFSLTGIADGFWGETGYIHDGNGQVAQARHGDGSAENFRYDAAHNIMAFAEGGSSGRDDGPGLTPAIAGSAWRPTEDTTGFIGWQLSDGGKVKLARGPQGERIHLTHDIRGRVVERKVERNGFRPKTWHYEWDAKDRLARGITPEGEAWRYGYDPFGRRVWKVRELTSGEVRKYLPHAAGKVDIARVVDPTQWLDDPREQPLTRGGQAKAGERDKPPVVGLAYGWDGNNLIEEAPLRFDGAIEWERAERWHYEPGSFRPLAKQEASRQVLNAEGKYEEHPGRLLYVVTDHLGTPCELFDEKGHKQWAAEYRLWGGLNRLWRAEPANDNGRAVYPSGGRRGSNGRADATETGGGRIYASYGNLALKQEEAFAEAKTECPIRFQGQWEDAESGLYYNRFRYYDPLAGQYLSPDPIGLAGGERPQGYVEDPSGWVDPWGLSARFWRRIKTFRGNKVYQRDDIIDPNRVDPETGLTNKQLMENGLAPYGPDGNKINLHHMLQTQDGPIAEMTQTFHQENYGNIHINSGTDIPSGINRSQFNSWKRSYWKDRALDF